MLKDLVRELLERAASANSEGLRSGSDYERGRHFAFYEVISLLVQQTDAFGIDRAAIGLGQVDPERDLLGPA